MLLIEKAKVNNAQCQYSPNKVCFALDMAPNKLIMAPAGTFSMSPTGQKPTKLASVKQDAALVNHSQTDVPHLVNLMLHSRKDV